MSYGVARRTEASCEACTRSSSATRSSAVKSAGSIDAMKSPTVIAMPSQLNPAQL